MIRWCDAAHVDDAALRSLHDRQDPHGGTLLVVATPKMDTPRKFLTEVLARLGKDVTAGASATRVEDAWAIAAAWLTAWQIADLVVCGAHRLPGRLIATLAEHAVQLAPRLTFVTDGPLDLARRTALDGAVPSGPSPIDAIVATLAPPSGRTVGLVADPLALDTDTGDTYRRYATLASHATAHHPATDDVWFTPLATPVAVELEATLASLDPMLVAAATIGIEVGIALHGYRWPDITGAVTDQLAARCRPFDRLARFREPTAGAALALAHLGFTPEAATALRRSDVHPAGRLVGTDPGQHVEDGHLRRALAAQLARYPASGSSPFLGLHGRTASHAEVVSMVRRAIRVTGGHLAA